jgi:hypothetical protein
LLWFRQQPSPKYVVPMAFGLLRGQFWRRASNREAAMLKVKPSTKASNPRIEATMAPTGWSFSSGRVARRFLPYR